MFYVIEIQKQPNDTFAHLVTTFENESEAKSKFHQILSYAAVSSLPVHTAIVITDEGTLLMRECYKHEVTG